MVTSYPVAATDRALTDRRLLTFGVEEEFLLLDPDTGSNAGTSLALGGAAVGLALAGRRLLANRA